MPSFFDELKFTDDDFKKKEIYFPPNVEIAFLIEKIVLNNEKKYLQIVVKPEKSQQHITMKHYMFFDNKRKITLLALLKAFYSQQEIVNGEWHQRLGEMENQSFTVKFSPKEVYNGKTYQRIIPSSLKRLLEEVEPTKNIVVEKIEHIKKGF